MNGNSNIGNAASKEKTNILSVLIAGIVLGILNIAIATSFAPLIFSGPLSGFLTSGLGYTLFGAFTIGMVVAITSSYPGMVAGLQETPLAIMALTASAITAAMPVDAGPETVLGTVVAAMVISTLTMGIFFLTLGQSGRGNLIRFVPFSVVGGFLAGTGWMIVLGAVGVMIDEPVSLSSLPFLFNTDTLLKWLPASGFALLLVLLQRKVKHFLLTPLFISAALAVFFITLNLTNTSVSEAGSAGWLLGPFPDKMIWEPINLSSLANVDWNVISGQLGNIISILMVSVLSLLLNASGLELTVKRDIDLNRELKSAGVANLLAGLGGSPVGYQSLTDTALGFNMGAKSRFTGIIAACLCGAALFFGAPALSYFPKPVAGALLVFLGLKFLVEWAYDSWFRLPKSDCFIVVLILFMIAVFGFLEGLLTGILAAVILFVVNYSRINVIQQSFSGLQFQSNVNRPEEQKKLLERKGEQILIMKLQGSIFFGTAHNLLDEIKKRCSDNGLKKLQFFVLDFKNVFDIDTSALNSFTKIKQLSEMEGFTVVFVSLSDELKKQFRRNMITVKNSGEFEEFDDLDHGAEYCENQLIAHSTVGLTEDRQSLEVFFHKMTPSSQNHDRVIKRFERLEIDKGHHLIHQGGNVPGLYFLESGQISAQLEHPDGTTTRLRSMGPGTIVGEIGTYLEGKASASIIATKPSVLHFLSIENLRKMEAEEPDIANTFHRFIVSILGERLAMKNRNMTTAGQY